MRKFYKYVRLKINKKCVICKIFRLECLSQFDNLINHMFQFYQWKNKQYKINNEIFLELLDLRKFVKRIYNFIDYDKIIDKSL